MLAVRMPAVRMLVASIFLRDDVRAGKVNGGSVLVLALCNKLRGLSYENRAVNLQTLQSAAFASGSTCLGDMDPCRFSTYQERLS
jgi:hypothetical protein